MYLHHTEPELVIMAVNRFWIDLIEARLVSTVYKIENICLFMARYL